MSFLKIDKKEKAMGFIPVANVKENQLKWLKGEQDRLEQDGIETHIRYDSDKNYCLYTKSDDYLTVEHTSKTAKYIRSK